MTSSVTRQKGSASTTALTAAIVAVVCAGVGFYIGRNVLGEQYLKLGTAKLRTDQSVAYTPQPVPDETPQIEEPENEPEESMDRPASAVTRTRPVSSPRPAAARPTAAPPEAAPRQVELRLGSYVNEDNAKIMIQDLRNRGYTPTVSAVRDGDSVLHRVTIKARSAEEGRALASQLRREGYAVSGAGED